AEAAEFGQNRCTPGACMLQILKNEDASAFAEHRAVAPFGKWEAALRRQNAHGLPGPHRAVCDRSLSRTGNGDVYSAAADHLEREADGMCRCRARADRAEYGPTDTVVDAHMRCGGASDRTQQRERMCRFFLVDKEIFIGFFERGKAAGARTDDRGRALAVLERRLKTGLLHCLRRGAAGILRIPVSQQKRLCVALNPRVEIPNLAADRDVQILQRKTF